MLRKFWTDISYAGINSDDQSFDSKRQIIFNQLNFLAIATCVIRLAFMGVTMTRSFSLLSFISCIIPILVCTVTAVMNGIGKYDYAKRIAFFLLPPSVGFIALQQQDHGLSMFPLMFCILSFFFLEGKTMIVAAFVNSSAWFITLQFAELMHNDKAHFFADLPLIIFNHLLILILVFLLLNFIRQMMQSYQEKLASRSGELAVKNAGLMEHQKEILNKTRLLEERQGMLEAANRHKNKMLSIISHDLRTPVLSVRNLLELHIKGIISEEQLLQYVPEINREMGNVTDLLENLLSWSKQQEHREVKTESIPLETLVHEVLGLYQFTAKGKSVHLLADIPDNVEIMADRQMIKTVLRNLVSNAVKFSAPGGRVMVNAEVFKNQVHLSVTDEGRGIPAENLERILGGEEITTKGTGGEFGSGLGLALCREFIHKNKSELQISSTPGMGSTFAFTLPVADHNPNILVPVNEEVLKPIMVLRPANR